MYSDSDILHTFYCSKLWRDFVYLLKLKMNPKGVCPRCKRVVNDSSKLIGHHIIPLTEENVADLNISLNEDNVEIICVDCHNLEHRRFGYEKRVYLVWGSPLAGKRALVSQVMRKGDLVVDIDLLWEAVTLSDQRDKPDNCRFNIFMLRDCLIDQIKTRYGQWYDAYLIGGYADRFQREKLAKELGAKEIYCESTMQECLERRELENYPTSYDRFIKEWWDKYSRYANPPPIPC